jgi:hypothetical protein
VIMRRQQCAALAAQHGLQLMCTCCLYHAHTRCAVHSSPSVLMYPFTCLLPLHHSVQFTALKAYLQDQEAALRKARVMAAKGKEVLDRAQQTFECVCWGFWDLGGRMAAAACT